MLSENLGLKVRMITLLYFVDLLSCLYGSPEEYDFPVWTWNLSDVWRSHEGVSHMPKVGGKKGSVVLGQKRILLDLSLQIVMLLWL